MGMKKVMNEDSEFLSVSSTLKNMYRISNQSVMNCQ